MTDSHENDTLGTPAADRPGLRRTWRKTVDRSATALDFLSDLTELPRARLKDAMTKGAVWRERPGTPATRVRKGRAVLSPGDGITLYYDERILAAPCPEASLVADRKRYSVWFKPAGLLSQGTFYGDHCAITRRVEKAFSPIRPVFVVHRLDREASGLMLLAHDKGMAAALSRRFAEHQIRKVYRVVVRGNPDTAPGLGGTPGGERIIDIPLDGKPARSRFRVLTHVPGAEESTVEAVIKTGRLHQIRRHFEGIGCPVVGDPRYGRGNKNADGLRLEAVALEFECPISRRWERFTSP